MSAGAISIPPATSCGSTASRPWGWPYPCARAATSLTWAPRSSNSWRACRDCTRTASTSHVINFLPDEVDVSVNDFVMNVLQSVGIVLLVMLLFLGLRTGLVVSSLIPTTMVVTLLLMSFLDIGLDQMSLASLIIALGMLVDNAIVLTESILVQMEAGKGRVEAAIDAAKELRVPLLTASLTTAAAFLPIYLAESSTGEYTAPLFKVVSLALLSSWALALTVTPLLTVTFLRVKKTEKKTDTDTASGFYRIYQNTLIWTLRHRLVTLGIVVVVFVGVMSQFSKIPQAFFPPAEGAQFTAKLNLPVGATIARTTEVVAQIEDFIRKQLQVPDLRETGDADGQTEGILNWATFVGAARRNTPCRTPLDPPSPEAALLILNATSMGAIDGLIKKLETFAWENFPDLDADIRPPLLGPPVNNPIEVRLLGKETDRLFALADEVKAKIRALPGTRFINDNWGPRTKKMKVKVDTSRAQRSGLTNQDIAVSLLTNLSGFTTSSYREDDKTIPIVTRSVAAERDDVGKLDTLNIFALSSGRNVP